MRMPIAFRHWLRRRPRVEDGLNVRLIAMHIALATWGKR